MSDAHASDEDAPLIVVVGATAVGKTEFSLQLAESIGGEIVNADSRQVYRYMDIGTAKPSADERGRAVHHLLDVVNPDEDYDVSLWRREALDALERIAETDRHAIVCGGTGLYVETLLRGIFEGPKASEALRRELRKQEHDDAGSLRRRLCEIDPASAERIHASDVLRTVRALEVFELTGSRLSDWHAEHARNTAQKDAVLIELELERSELYQRIDRRAQAMVENGFVDEVRDLRARGYDRRLKAFRAIGYQEAWAVIAGELGADALAERIAKASRNYAKRQLTWNRQRFKAALRLAPTDISRARDECARYLDRVAKRRGKR